MNPAGAGGKWTTINERKDDSVVKQENDLSCGVACAEMIFRKKGLDINQLQIREIAGSPTWAEQLAFAMNQLNSTSDGKWQGGFFNIIGATDKQIFLSLCQTGSWIAELREPLAKIGHFVVVDGIDNEEKPLIRDPWDGTSYKMEIEEFLNHWTFQGIFWRKK